MVSHARGVGPGAIGHLDPAIAGGLQIDFFITGANHADDVEQGQGGHFIIAQTQRAAGQHDVDTRAVSGDGLGAAGGAGRKNQFIALVFQQIQTVVNRFNQHQHYVAHGVTPDRDDRE